MVQNTSPFFVVNKRAGVFTRAYSGPSKIRPHCARPILATLGSRISTLSLLTR